MFALNDSVKGIDTTSAFTGTPGVSEYSSGRWTLNFCPTLPTGNPLLLKEPSKGTYPIAIFLFCSGWYQGDVIYPQGSPPSAGEISQKSGAYSSIGLLITSSIGLLMTRVKRKRDTSEASILALIFGYPMVISFGYLAIVAIVYFPISVASTLIGRL